MLLRIWINEGAEKELKHTFEDWQGPTPCVGESLILDGHIYLVEGRQSEVNPYLPMISSMEVNLSKIL